MELRDFGPQTAFFFLILMQYVSHRFVDPEGQPLTHLFAAFLLTVLVGLGGFFDGILEFLALIPR